MPSWRNSMAHTHTLSYASQHHGWEQKLPPCQNVHARARARNVASSLFTHASQTSWMLVRLEMPLFFQLLQVSWHSGCRSWNNYLIYLAETIPNEPGSWSESLKQLKSQDKGQLWWRQLPEIERSQSCRCQLTLRCMQSQEYMEPESKSVRGLSQICPAG